MIELVPATKSSVRKNYEYFHGGMTDIIKKVEGDFLPADIYHQLMLENIHLYWIEEEGGSDRLGFAILSQYESGYEKSPTLMIDQLWIRPGANVFLETVAAGRELAQKIGVERMEFNSARMGWGRRARELGFTPVCVTYRCKVNSNG